MARTSAAGIAAGVLVVVVAAVCVRLGFWQLHRLEERRASNSELTAALAAPPIRLPGPLLDSIVADPSKFRFRRATVQGAYDPSGGFILRGRARQGAPGVHLIAPLTLNGGSGAILVDRGWLPSNDAATADPRPYASDRPVTVEGLLLPLEETEADPAAVDLRLDGAEVRSYQRLDASTLRSSAPYPLLPILLQRIPVESGADELPLAVPIPSLDEGPHLGYAFQWFSFAAIAVIGFCVVLVRGRSAR